MVSVGGCELQYIFSSKHDLQSQTFSSKHDLQSQQTFSCKHDLQSQQTFSCNHDIQSQQTFSCKHDLQSQIFFRANMCRDAYLEWQCLYKYLPIARLRRRQTINLLGSSFTSFWDDTTYFSHLSS